ncbi:serine hydrolase domain-containing protein [Psychroserpens sp. Hel_I_66]|uniref:serine hydrolase domain-containing protein n=1 Tax=Psychroserpens sp. Hel_I_66 TaxID=1250004 RepID=UPI0018CCEC1F|nr:serine hydrolase domain-containing protein [Psychroserpens sp. Hel_I_66]
MKIFWVLFSICFSLFTNAQNNLRKTIDSILKIYDTNNEPGLSIRVIKQDSIVYSKSFGVANLDYNIKNTDSTIFSLGSISKQFTAAAIWSLIRDSKLSLEDNITSFFPDFPNYGRPIKIKHLLNHSSGIRNYHTTMFLSGFDYNNDYYDNTYVLNLVKRQKNLNNHPGEKIIYSNTNYNLLALIIEQVSNQNLDEYLKDKILKPLGMKDTFVRISHGTIVKNKAVGYQKQKDTYVFNSSNQLSYGAGSMGSHIKDMNIWMRMLNGDILEFKTLAQFLKTTEVLTSKQKAKYARGIMVDDYKGYKTLSHSGYGFGNQSHIITVPKEKIGIVILTNLESINPTPISYEILDLLLVSEENIKPNLIEDKISFEPQDLILFTGDYREINSDMTMRISEENDTLKAQGSMGNSKIPLLQNNTNEFVRRDAQNVKYNFEKTSHYDMVISFGGTPFYFKRANLINTNPENLIDYCGEFYSEELQTTYHFYIDKDQLKLSYKNNTAIALYPIEIDAFGNKDRTLYQFVKTKDSSEITGMFLSCDGQVSNIEFTKDQTQD